MRNFCLFFVVGFFMVSCYTASLKMSVLEPAPIDLPQEISKVSIFPGTYVSRKSRIDSLNDIRLYDSSDASQILIGYLDGIFEVLAASPRLQRVIFSDSSYSKLVDDGHIYWEDLTSICTHDTTDVILLLQKAVIYDDLQYKDTDYKKEYIGEYRIRNHTKWAFLQPFEERSLAIFADSDSLLLFGFFSSGQTEKLLYQSCYTSGYLTGRKLVPFWQDTMRTYFDGPGRDLRISSKLIDKNNWRAAGLIWNDLANGPKRGLASKAAYNMAIAWEHNDQLDQSIAWLEYADSLKSNKHIILYRQILEKRIAKQKILDQQMQ